MARAQVYGSAPTARKPHRDFDGYICELRNPLTGGHNIVVLTAGQRLDEDAGKYTCICNEHHTLISGNSLPAMRACMKDAATFCDDCRALAAAAPTPATT